MAQMCFNGMLQFACGTAERSTNVECRRWRWRGSYSAECELQLEAKVEKLGGRLIGRSWQPSSGKLAFKNRASQYGRKYGMREREVRGLCKAAWRR